MRRSDREIKEFDEMIQIVKKCDVCRIAMNDGEFPYLVPLNFGLDIQDGQVYLYFHGALEGKKMDVLRKNNKVTFEMDCDHNFIFYDDRMSCTMGYESIIGHGTMELLKEEQKFDALKILMRQYHEEDFKFNTDMMKVTSVFRLKVLDMTGKRRNNVHPNAGKQHGLKMS
ncbi:pyridoxamine 5'-phosphate oxidase family protein [uncultured Holdemanella sp.]|uniref:pyridoxamine 5'-phosphate oxidase family protein n=1 Tax=uncultured Holdemanella sp. TaxID=1763549 RepID=UPI0025D0A8FE|nr:pyridoxamine 5'-phosphate oxidase family protein [uncultured Holdemanella sp.]